MNPHQHGEEHPSGRWQNMSIVLMMVCCLALIGIFFFIQPGASGYGWLPILLLMACPLMHLFMHRGHSGH